MVLYIPIKKKIDVFFHITDIKGANPPKIEDRVFFILKEVNGKWSACDVEITHANSRPKPIKSLQGFPCIRGELINDFKVAKIIKKITTYGYDTVAEAQDNLIRSAKECGANAVFNYIWHRESDWSDDYFLIFHMGRSRKTTFWAEGNAVRLIQS